MKIAIISPYISSSKNIEFYQSQQINLAIELAKLGLKVDIITAQNSSEPLPYSHTNGQIRIFQLPTIAIWAVRFLKQPVMTGLWKQLRNENYDFVQSSEFYTISTLVAGIHALFKKSRLIIYQGMYCYSHKKTVKAVMILHSMLIAPILKRAYCEAVCKTRQAAEYLQRKGFTRIQVIPIGVNTSLFYPEKRKTSKTIKLLAVGNLIPLKNYQLILEVFRQLVAMNPDAKLTIIGSGSEQKKIEYFIRENGFNDKVQLLENVPNSQMHKYYNQADLLLFLSKVEMFGMAMLEAMACGCPVLSSTVPAALDVITDNVNGFIVYDTNPTKIACRIIQILSRPKEFESIRQKAIKTILEKFSWPIIARQYYDLYLEKANCQ